MLKVILILTAAGWGNANINAIPVTSIIECQSTANIVFQHLAKTEKTFNSVSSVHFACIDAETGVQLTKRVYLR